MKDENPNLALGDFVRVTGKLKADFYIGRDGKPSGTLLIIAFNALKIAKPSELKEESKDKLPLAPKVEPKKEERALCKGPNGSRSQRRKWFRKSSNQTGRGCTTDRR